MRHAARINLNPSNLAGSCLNERWHSHFKSKSSKPTIYQIISPISHLLKNQQQKIANPDTPIWKIKPPIIDTLLTELIKKDETNPHISKTLSLEIINNYTGDIHIYTDGSKTENAVACAAYIINYTKTIQKRLHSNSSIFIAELTAINSSLSWLLEQQLNNLKYENSAIIFTDSLSSLQALKHPQNQPVTQIFFDILKNIHILRENNFNIKLCWIPSHVGIPANEIVDNLAKNATVFPPPIDAEKFTLAEIYNNIDNHILYTWQQQIDAYKGAKHYKETQDKVNFNIKFAHQNSKIEATITRLRLGHTNLNYDKFLRKHTDDPN